MRSHISIILPRIIKAGLRSPCRYRVVAVGIDHNNTIINIKTNSPRLSNRGWHAEERLIHACPRSLRRIIIARVGAKGELLPIDPCEKCYRLASNRGIKIDKIPANNTAIL